MNSKIHAHASYAPATLPSQTPKLELLTQVQMAQRLGITRRTLHTWVLNGTVPMIKVRGYCRFDAAKVWAALQQHERPVGGGSQKATASSPKRSPSA
ncbi:MAG: hypothetical protein B7Z37_07240 [Verrucomicrobia bacterium 12-59-8]|nr:MAG: hypothetical protein B7Z37_07240 [Verrucomicrobia bacterium 12-59-8]